MTTNNAIPLSGLARRLVKDGILEEVEAQQCYQQAARDKVPFVSYLVEQGIADGTAIAQAASDEFGTPYFDLRSHNSNFIPQDLVAEKLIRTHHTLPLFKRGKRLFIALSDPTNLRALDEINVLCARSKTCARKKHV